MDFIKGINSFELSASDPKFSVVVQKDNSYSNWQLRAGAGALLTTLALIGIPRFIVLPGMVGLKPRVEVMDELKPLGNNVIGPLESHNIDDATKIVNAVEAACNTANTTCLPDRDPVTGTYTVKLTTELLAQNLSTAMNKGSLTGQGQNVAYQRLAAELQPYTGSHQAISQYSKQ